MKVMDTPTLLKLAADADKQQRNRRLKTRYLTEDLDPAGIHVVALAVLHNDFEVRMQLLMKVKDSDVPREGWLDIEVGQFNALAEVAG